MNEPPHIVVVGSVMADMTVWIDRLPAAGETIEGRSFLLGFGGKGANQAVMASLLGARVSMVACVGEDAFGAEAVDNLQASGIDARGVAVIAGASTGVAPIWVDGSGQNRIVIVPGANSLMDVEHVDRTLDLLDPPDVVICQLEVPVQSVRRALERGRECGAITVLNPAPFVAAAAELLPLADWLVPNELEFAALARLVLVDEAPRQQERLLADIPDVVEAVGTSILVTNGEHGALMCREGASATATAAAPAVSVVDSSGAGDAFVGAFACSLAGGQHPVEAMQTACRCASFTVELPGTQASFAASAEQLRAESDGAPDVRGAPQAR